MGNRHCKAVRFGTLVRPREQHELARTAAVPMRLDRRDLRRLMLERIEAVLVADEELQRRSDRSEGDGHADHGMAMLQMFAGEDVSRPNGEDHEWWGQLRRRHHQRMAEWEARC